MSPAYESGLVSTDWLAQRLGDDHLRVFDCTVFLDFDPADGISARAGRPEYEEAHIPGAAFVDLYNDLSAQGGDGPFMMRPSAEALNRALSGAGLANDHQAVLYSSSSTVYWATRLWWILRANGFTSAAVLDGGLRRWQSEGRPTVGGQERYPAATFTARPDSRRWANQEEVLAEIGSASVCTVNTLSRESHLGILELSPFEQMAYGRKGRIQGSRNAPYASMLTEEGLFVPTDQLRQAFGEIGALDHERIILYCGAGLSSTMGALVLHLLGYDNVAIYDGSLNEWGWNQSLPMETD